MESLPLLTVRYVWLGRHIVHKFNDQTYIYILGCVFINSFTWDYLKGRKAISKVYVSDSMTYRVL